MEIEPPICIKGLFCLWCTFQTRNRQVGSPWLIKPNISTWYRLPLYRSTAVNRSFLRPKHQHTSQNVLYWKPTQKWIDLFCQPSNIHVLGQHTLNNYGAWSECFSCWIKYQSNPKHKPDRLGTQWCAWGPQQTFGPARSKNAHFVNVLYSICCLHWYTHDLIGKHDPWSSKSRGGEGELTGYFGINGSNQRTGSTENEVGTTEFELYS